ncbi:MAG: SemiSWEET transporter [Chitinophagaceae bacterium]
MAMTPTTFLGLLAASLTTISFLPQAIHTIRSRNTSGISLYMYLIFTVGTGLWLTYGIISHDLPIMAGNMITFVFCLIILSFKLKYK